VEGDRAGIATDAAIADLAAEGLSVAGRGRLALPIATAAALLAAAAVPRAIREARDRRGAKRRRSQPSPIAAEPGCPPSTAPPMLPEAGRIS
jgi:hypothetical protein